MKYLFTLAAFSLLISCNKLDKGVIVHKWYEESTTRPVMLGKIVSVRRVPEKYMVTISGEHEGRLLFENFDIHPELWERSQLGDTIYIND